MSVSGRRSLQQSRCDYYLDKDLDLTAETIEEALEKHTVPRDSKLAQDALAFQLDYSGRTDKDIARLAAFGCRLLLNLWFCERKKDREFLMRELEALTELAEKLPAKSPSLRERDFLDAVRRDYWYWILRLPKQVNSVIEALNKRVVVIDMRP